MITLANTIIILDLIGFIVLIFYISKIVISRFEKQDIVSRTKRYAIKCHKSVNQKYDGKPYITHLSLVDKYGDKYSYLLENKDVNICKAGCWVHDVIEDTGQTFNDVKEECGLEIAEIAYALTNEKGKNRKERANQKYYDGIKANPNFVFVKICDRLANIKYSKDKGSSMFDKYKKEYTDFHKQLYIVKFDDMFKEMANLLELNGKN